MPKTMAITHADLEPKRSSTDLGSKIGAFLIVLTILCGLFCFILCLIAEATRSEVLSLKIQCFYIAKSTCFLLEKLTELEFCG